MADLEVIFPKTEVALRPLDMLSRTITLILGFTTLISNIDAGMDSFASLLSIVGFLGVASKVYFDYWFSMQW